MKNQLEEAINRMSPMVAPSNPSKELAAMRQIVSELTLSELFFLTNALYKYLRHRGISVIIEELNDNETIYIGNPIHPPIVYGSVTLNAVFVREDYLSPDLARIMIELDNFIK